MPYCTPSQRFGTILRIGHQTGEPPGIPTSYSGWYTHPYRLNTSTRCDKSPPNYLVHATTERITKRLRLPKKREGELVGFQVSPHTQDPPKHEHAIVNTPVQEKDTKMPDRMNPSEPPSWTNPHITSLSPVVRELPFAASEKSPFSKLAYVIHGHLSYPDSVTHTYCVTIDTGCGPNLLRYDLVPPQWRTLIHEYPDPGLAGASGKKLTFHGIIPIVTHVGDLSVRIWYGLVDDLPPGIIVWN